MKIFVASDHNGFEVKKEVISYLKSHGLDVIDSGDEKLDLDDDFPVFAAKAATDLLSSPEHDSRAILICGSGQGMVMAANRFKGIRAGLGYSRESAKSIRNDEDSNVLAVPAKLFYKDKSLFNNILDDFINTPFAGATRFVRRNKELDEI